uniref:branched-chain amino acid transport system II carrier protein n=1 Tax=Ndongobacter massiliensis TaxID=1871025 RepID=UPI00092FED9D|nr:branched-chain amino acid transport system II carrier protein [Ndongobacter massiliensis]
MKKLAFRQTVLVGLLLFGLFFGAGNLIFPVFMGQLAGKNVLPATLGFWVAGIGLPVLGVISYALSQKHDLNGFASIAGPHFGLFFTVALYLTICPLFAIPRTATTAFETGLRTFFPDSVRLPLFLYSVVFFALAYFFAKYPTRIMDIIGRWMAPIFLVLLSILLIFVILRPMGAPADFPAQPPYDTRAFVQGILDGYNTMDALASLAFAIIIITNIRAMGVSDAKRMAVEVFKAGLVTLVLMATIYGALSYLGASSLGVMELQSNGATILGLTANHYFALFGQLLLALIVFVACLKTAVGLIVAISGTFSRLFPKGPSYNQWMVLFTLLSFGIANFGLNTIISLSIPVLMFLYPLSIGLMLLWIIHAVHPLPQRVFSGTLFVIGIAALFDFIKAAPPFLSKQPFAIALLDKVKTYLPLFTEGMGWLLPGTLAFLGLLLWAKIGKKSADISKN